MRHYCALAVGLTAFASALRADDLLRLDYGPAHNLGGEFKLTPVSGNSPGVTGKPSDVSLDSLESFCMQADELIAPGNIYRFEINTGVPSSSGGFDPLDPRSAYLYTFFRNGTLPGYDYGAGRTASANDLQNAFWFIEGELYGVNNAFVAQADAAVAPGGVWEGKGIDAVRVLNLFNADRSPAQDQLTLLPVPGPMALAGLAAMVLARRRR